MISSLVNRRIVRLGVCSLVFLAGLVAAAAAERKMEARLIWGTNQEKSPDPAHKRLEGELAKKLGEMPLKWKNYFEVNRRIFTINDQIYTNIAMSKQCAIEVKDKGANNVTVKLYGEGKPVRRVDKPLPKGEVLTIGGDDKNNSAWFITVRPVNGDTRSSDPKRDAPVEPQPALAKPEPPKPGK
jgi:hypothetical protein